MQGYGEDPYEREPLGNTDPSYDSPPRRPFPASRSYDQQDSPYYDRSPAPQHPESYGYDPGYGSPIPPPHGEGFMKSAPAAASGSHSQHGQSSRGIGYPQPSSSAITPGADNFGDSASGGMAGIAYSVADRNARESGVEAMRGTGQVPPPPSRSQYPNLPRQTLSPQASGGYRYDHSSYGAGAGPAGTSRSSSRSPQKYAADPYADDPYQSYSTAPRGSNPRLGVVDPNDIEDDGDDGLFYARGSQRNSMLSSSNSDRGARAGAAGAGGAVASGLLGRSAYHGASTADFDAGPGPEKSSAWLADRKESRKKKKKWGIIIGIVLVVVAALVGGIVGGLLTSGAAGSGGDGGGDDDNSNGPSAEDDTKENGDLSINSAEIQDLMNNPDLHRVFPGMDYTPMNAQYPHCVHDPPSQNNITRDIAVLSQLTNKIRLYGTDCNQTQMVIHAVNQLELADDVKIWMGVWQDGNDTTNKRQLDQMWTILEDYGGDPFEGIIVANEILFREETTISALGKLLGNVRERLSNMDIDLPVATSDLGDDWTQALADESDYIMSNIHPFFAGTDASDAAEWTWGFWEDFNSPLWKSEKSKNIISETGWPTSGGTNCGQATTCTDGAVASVDGLNTFMEGWVCPALRNGTNYFWFSAFDEPWKIEYNEKGKEWEDKWGLMDVNRNLKDGVTIPDCDGRTVS